MAKPVQAERILEAVGEDDTDVFDTENEMQNILAEFDRTAEDDKWEIKVYRVLGSAKLGNREPFLFYAQPSDFPILEKLRDEWNGGTFRVRVYRNRMLVKNFTFDVEKKPEQKNPPVAELKSELAGVVQTVADMMQKQSERTESLFREMLQARSPVPQSDPFDQLQKIVAVIAGVKDATRVDAPAAQPAVSAERLMDVFTKGIDFAERLGGDKGETGIWDIAKEMIRALPAMAASQPAQPQVQPQHNTPKQVDRINVKPAIPNQSPAPDPNEQMKEMLQYLVTRAQRNSDPGFYADWVAENVPADLIVQLVSQSDPVALAATMEPAVGKHKTWFTELVAELRNLVDTQREHAQERDDAARQNPAPYVSDGDPGRPGGNEDDPSNNEPLGKGW